MHYINIENTFAGCGLQHMPLIHHVSCASVIAASEILQLAQSQPSIRDVTAGESEGLVKQDSRSLRPGTAPYTQIPAQLLSCQLGTCKLEKHPLSLLPSRRSITQRLSDGSIALIYSATHTASCGILQCSDFQDISASAFGMGGVAIPPGLSPLGAA